MSKLYAKFMTMMFATVVILFGVSHVFAADLTVIVANVHGNKGHIMIAIFDQDRDWPEGEAKYAAAIIPAVPSSVSVTFHGLPTGNYAIAVFHDEDDNEQLNKNFIGIPTESYGFSNAAQAFTAAMIDLPMRGRQLTIPLVD